MLAAAPHHPGRVQGSLPREGRGEEEEQPLPAAGSVLGLGEQAMPEAGAVRVGHQAGMQDPAGMAGKSGASQGLPGWVW